MTSNFSKILSKTFLPPEFTNSWNVSCNFEKLQNIIKVECKNIIEEINYVVKTIKEHYNNTDVTIALITTDNIFAEQIYNILKNEKLPVYNTFGNKFSRQESINYLFLILDVIKQDFATIPLLSLLKHKFTTIFNESEIIALENSLEGGWTIEQKENDFTNKIKALLKLKTSTLSKMLKQHVEIVEQIAHGEIFNDNVITFLNEIVMDSEVYGEIKDLDEYSNLLDFLIAENSFSPNYATHPEISIISPQEARLFNFDVVFLSNCNDHKFPYLNTIDPWMNKDMRKKFGLPSKDENIGQFAMDFCQILSNKKVYITRAWKEEEKTTIPSRFLLRLEGFLKCQNMELLKEKIRESEVDSLPLKIQPNPTPPISKRPTSIYATSFKTLLNNPYSFYAKQILKLKKRKEFNTNKNNILFGNAVHSAIENYTKYYKGKDLNLLLKYAKQSFNEYFKNDEVSKIFFYHKFEILANSFVEEDDKIRQDGWEIIAEADEKFTTIQGVKVRAKIDRIERKNESTNIVDFKTGAVPEFNKVMKGEEPQLIIEAIILKDVENVVYWQVKGNNDERTTYNDYKPKGKRKKELKELMEEYKKQLTNIITYFNVYEHGYICTGYDLKSPHENDYRHLSRIDEWILNK